MLHPLVSASNSSARSGSPQPRVAAAVVPSTGPRAVDGLVFCSVFRFVSCGGPVDVPAGGAGGSGATVTVVVAEAGPASVAAGVPVPGARTTTTTAVPVAR